MGFSSCFSNVVHQLKDPAICTIPAGLGSGAVSWLGRTITNAGFLHGLGFGIVTAITFQIVQPILEEKIKKDWVSLGASAIISGAVAYGLSAGAAALGIVAAPITVTGALILTITSLAFGILGLFGEDLIKDICCKKENSSKYENAVLLNELADAERLNAMRRELVKQHSSG